MNTCPCGSNQPYFQCCGPFIECYQIPLTPEKLMRSRYTAYTQANINYIKSTMKGNPLNNFNEIEVKKWALEVDWIKLEVLDEEVNLAEKKGIVEFIASFHLNGKIKFIHELSEFRLFDDDRWYYIKGHAPRHPLRIKSIPISLNSPCFCLSKKKYKNCHGSKS